MIRNNPKDEIASFDRHVRRSRCHSCGADIVWASTLTKKLTPMQLDPEGRWKIEGGVTKLRMPGDEGPFYTSHFAHCPDAKGWRKR